MTTVERSIFIDAPPDVSFDVGIDAGHWFDWYEGMQSVQPDDMYPDIGSVVEVSNRTAGLTLNLTLTVIEYIPGQVVAYQMDGMITGTMRWVYQSEDSGTYLTAVYDYEVPGGTLGMVADRLIVERANTDNLEASLENLKALIEG
jgi:uncharacterized membrane protein